jgi:hypothetical protein
LGPGGVAPGPVDAQKILRRHAAPFAVVITELNRVRAVLVDNHDNVQPAAAREKSGGGKKPDAKAGTKPQANIHALILA